MNLPKLFRERALLLGELARVDLAIADALERAAGVAKRKRGPATPVVLGEVSEAEIRAVEGKMAKRLRRTDRG